MGACNEFRFVGVCYGDSRRKLTSENKYKTYFTICCDSFDSGRNNFIPIVAPNNISELAFNLCRNGNKVAVIGEAVSTELNNLRTGFIELKIHFVATSVMLIQKVERTELNDKKFSDVACQLPIEESIERK